MAAGPGFRRVNHTEFGHRLLKTMGLFQPDFRGLLSAAMGHSYKVILAGLLLFAGAVAARGQALITINFDDIAFGSNPAEQYASLGVHFLGVDAGIQNGLTNGDSGNWGVDGTNGPFFLGFNGPSYSETITIDAPAVSVSLDVSRTSGSAPTDTFTLTAFAGSTPVATQTITLLTQNVWQTVTLNLGGPVITSLQLDGAGLGFHPYGVDNLQFNAVPEPSTWALLGGGLLGIAWLRRRR